ncbi:hypothetical protein Dda_4748 [Drechslerella dactyloides]|uniref:Uncharacterized protein n=1 Tax=Drechslerella dactyloides TaxID=74499 RepID=A0AAD6IY99_DREDA|nr:hypothetical protein Dda_4748 [Drechslerella dactyloides]
MTVTNVASLPDFKLIPYSTASPDTDTEILRTSSWTYCGPLLPVPPADHASDNPNTNNLSLPPSYEAWEHATFHGSITPLLLPFLRFAHAFLAEAGLTHYWLTIRASLPTADYDLPRWHTDDDFFARDSDSDSDTSPADVTDTGRTQWKLATTLLGPGTLFLADSATGRATQAAVKSHIRDSTPPHPCTTVACPGCAATADTVRRQLATSLQDASVTQTGAGECAFFKVGKDVGAVHSEPSMREQRVFVNVVPGREAELRGVMRRWGMEFPRAWSLPPEGMHVR